MWTARLTGVPECGADTVVYINAKFYSFCARHAGSRNFVDVFAFDPSTHRWDKVQTELPGDRQIVISLYTIVAYGHCVYLWGGPYDGPPQSVLYRFDTTTMTWSRPEVSGEEPRPFPGNSACVVGQRKYVLGAFETWRHVRFLDLNTMEWRSTRCSGHAPIRRSYHTASVIGTRIYVWGGTLRDPSIPDRFDNCLHYLETTTSTWVLPHVEGVRPVGREGHSAFVYNEELYIFGGFSPLKNTYFADMRKYDPNTSSWTEVKPCGSGPSARSFHGCCTTGERVYFFDGLGPRPNQEHEAGAEEETGLTDLHVLHLAPTLRNLCLLAVIDSQLDTGGLPPNLRNEINAITPG